MESVSVTARSLLQQDLSLEALVAEKASARAASYSQALPALFRPAGGRVTQLVVQNPSFSSQLQLKCGARLSHAVF